MHSPPNKHTIIKRLSAENSKRFGETFLVKINTSDDLFVLKIVEKSNEIGYNQLINESTFTFELKGLPKVLSIEETETHFSIIKEYNQGINLNEYFSKIRRRKRLKKLCEIVISLEPIFEELRQQQIVHCDIKPENILVNENENGLKCSIIDFGLAFRKNDIPKRKTLFQLAYSAPEIVLNRLNCADFSTDVFSFCLLVYKVLNSRLPFSNSNPALLTQLQITYPIEKPFRIKKKIWEILEKGLVKHQFKKSPNKYYIEEIDAFLQETNAKRYKDFNEFSSKFTS